jgi:hypothetical protein
MRGFFVAPPLTELPALTQKVSAAWASGSYPLPSLWVGRKDKDETTHPRLLNSGKYQAIGSNSDGYGPQHLRWRGLIALFQILFYL